MRRCTGTATSVHVLTNISIQVNTAAVLRNCNSPWNGSTIYNNQNNITQEKNLTKSVVIGELKSLCAFVRTVEKKRIWSMLNVFDVLLLTTYIISLRITNLRTFYFYFLPCLNVFISGLSVILGQLSVILLIAFLSSEHISLLLLCFVIVFLELKWMNEWMKVAVGRPLNWSTLWSVATRIKQ